MTSFVRFLTQESRYLYNTELRPALTWFFDLFTVIEGEEESKRPRDPRPLLDISNITTRNYNYAGMEMSLLSKDRKIISIPTHCRDYFNEAIRWHVWRGKGGVWSQHCSEDYKGFMDRKTFRAVIFLDAPMRGSINPLDGIKNGVRLANMYGRVAGWKPIHVCRAVVPRNDEGEIRECYVLTGDRNWQRTPQYISMLMLLIRICLVYEVPKSITDAYALTDYWYKFLYFTADRPENSDILIYLANSYHHMLLMVAHDREIFPYNMRKGYPSGGDGFHGRSGLNALVRGESFHPEAGKKLKYYYTTEVMSYGRGS